MRPPDLLGQRLGVRGKSRQYKAGVAAGGVPGDAARFQHRHRPAPPRHFQGDGQPGEPATDHADINVQLESEWLADRGVDRARGIPACAVDRWIGRGHSSSLSPAAGYDPIDVSDINTI